MTRSIVSAVGLVLLIGSINAAKHHKIIGGENAALKHFPYIVSLRFYGFHFCAGTIISDRHILTAAHCVAYKDVYRFKVHSGTGSHSKSGNAFVVKSKKVHPTYKQRDEVDSSDDIAVLTLEKPIVFNKLQQKIDLPTHDVQNYEAGYVIGWGRTSATDYWEKVDQLQKLKMALLPSDKCKPYLITKIDETQVCVFRKTGKAACRGDNGGPLIAHGEIVGIVSQEYINKQCADGSPNIYTNVYAYKSFIEEAMKE